MHWLLTGLPLALIGLFCASRGLAGGFVDSPFLSLAVFYLVAAGGAASQNPRYRKVAMAAWAPLLLAIPVGTVLGLLSMRLLRDNSADDARDRAAQLLTPEAAAQLVRREASVVLDVGEDEMRDSLESELQIPPVEVINFLRDLRIDHGLPITGDDRERIGSVEDVVQLVTARMNESAVRGPSGMLVPLAQQRGQTASDAELSPYRPPSAEGAAP